MIFYYSKLRICFKCAGGMLLLSRAFLYLFFVCFLCVSGVVGSVEQIDTKNWMSQLAGAIGYKRLGDLYIPGTHDSCAYSLEDSIARNQDLPKKLRYVPGVSGFMKKWAKTQSLSIFQQLEAGARYLDFRVVYRESQRRFYALHTLYCIPLDEALEQVKAFTDQHPHEIVIIELGDFSYMPAGGHEQFNKLMIETLSEKRVVRETEASKTLVELWALGRQVVLLHNKKDKGFADQIQKFTTFLPTGEKVLTRTPEYFDLFLDSNKYLDYFYPDSPSFTEAQQKIANRLDQLLNKPASGRKSFVVTSFALTPDNDTIVDSLKPFSWDGKKLYRNLEELSKEVKQHIFPWYFELDASLTSPCVVAYDFADAYTNKFIIARNFKLRPSV